MRVFVISANYLHSEVYQSFDDAWRNFMSYAGMTAEQEDRMRDEVLDHVDQKEDFSFKSPTEGRDVYLTSTTLN